MSLAVVKDEEICENFRKFSALVEQIIKGYGVLSHNTLIHIVHEGIVTIEQNHLQLCGRCATCRVIYYLIRIKNGKILSLEEEVDLNNCLHHLKQVYRS